MVVQRVKESTVLGLLWVSNAMVWSFPHNPIGELTTKVPGQIIEAGHTKNLRDSPARPYPMQSVVMPKSICHVQPKNCLYQICWTMITSVA